MGGCVRKPIKPWLYRWLLQTSLYSRTSNLYGINASKSNRAQFVAEAIFVDHENEFIDVEVKNKFSVGDKLELVMPDGENHEIILESMGNLKGEAMDVAPGSGHQVRIPTKGLDIKGDRVIVSRFF